MKALALSAAVAALFLAGAVQAFANVKEGDVVEEATLPTLEGGNEVLLGKSQVALFLFFRGGQEHSKVTLKTLAECQQKLAGKSVRWTAIVSDRFPAAEVAAEIKESGYQGIVLVDKADALYGKFGVALHPVIGIAGKDHKLLAYQPFTKINYADVICARVQWALGEITEAQMKTILEPPAATQGGEAQVARRFFKMGERLFTAKDYDKALESAKKSIEHDPKLAAAHGLAAAILAAKGDCKEAGKEIAEALAIDPKEELAAGAKKTCP